jgi:hypothetical protein
VSEKQRTGTLRVSTFLTLMDIADSFDLDDVEAMVRLDA